MLSLRNICQQLLETHKLSGESNYAINSSQRVRHSPSHTTFAGVAKTLEDGRRRRKIADGPNYRRVLRHCHRQF